MPLIIPEDQSPTEQPKQKMKDFRPFFRMALNGWAAGRGGGHYAREKATFASSTGRSS